MTKKNAAIVLVHGIWMTGIEFFFLRIRFRLKGFRVYTFHYHSLLKTPAQSAEKLDLFISGINEPVVHFIAHSLGGIILSHLFSQHPPRKNGKVVFIASPLNGSAVARYLAKHKLFKYFLAKSLTNGLLGDGPRWEFWRPTCVIAGSNKLGVGYLLAKSVMQTVNDGTVNLEETFLEDADESHIVHHTHFSLLFSNGVVELIAAFLLKND